MFKKNGDAAIAGMGIANKVVSLVTLLLVGFAAGAQPIMGYSYGAKNNKRLGELLRFLFKAAVIGGFVGGAIIFIFANAIVRVFIDDVQIVSYGTSMLRALMISSPVVGIIFVLSNLFQAMGKGTQSMVLAVGRQGIIFIPVIYIMSHLLGLKGIIISQALTDILTAILAISMFIHVKRKENLTLKKEVKIGA
ncbi:MAG: MATE family efflux transporter [Terrisporobacter sp.]|uniref:MATE family efflux transporter n=1 Tax=Terrisporobacter sp. TaxID=1965305 RepID=UPI002F93B8BB